MYTMLVLVVLLVDARHAQAKHREGGGEGEREREIGRVE